MIFRLLHVTIAPVHVQPDFDRVKARLNELGRDWIQYSGVSFILWTNKSTITVSEMLSELIEPIDFLLVLPINPLELPAGRLPSWVWEWINRPRNISTGDVHTPLSPAPHAVNYFDRDNPFAATLLAHQATGGG